MFVEPESEAGERLLATRGPGAVESASLGEAAYGAGFADAAHMTRTFRRLFGVTPSEALRRSQSVQDRSGPAP